MSADTSTAEKPDAPETIEARTARLAVEVDYFVGLAQHIDHAAAAKSMGERLDQVDKDDVRIMLFLAVVSLAKVRKEIEPLMKEALELADELDRAGIR